MEHRLIAIALLTTAYLTPGNLAMARDLAADYAVATANGEATDAGMRVLATGGTAADAAVAIQMVLGVVEPQSSGLGGGAIALYHSASNQQTTAFDGLARSPATYDPKAGAATGFSHSGVAVGVPGSLRMLEVLQRRYGKLPWRTLFQPAIELVEKGFPVSPYLATSLAAATRIGMKVPPWLTDASGKAVTEGTVVRNPELAETLRAVARDGADALYVNLADQVVAAVQQASLPGHLTINDLKNYRAVERKPLCMPLQQQVLCAFPPPSYGGVAVLEMLGILQNRRRSSDSFLDPEFAHWFIEAGRLAEADRMGVVGDPDIAPVPVQKLIDPAHLRAEAALISSKSTMKDPVSSVPDCLRNERAPQPSTSQVTVVDAWGDALAMTTTININFGSWLTVGGFFLNDAMTNFSEPSVAGCAANAPAGNKRAETSMAPVIATDRNGSVVLVGGSAGAGEVVDYVSQAVLELFAGRSPTEALDAGHVSTAEAPYPATAGLVELERERAVAQLARPLAALGHPIRIAPLRSGTAFIVRRDGHWEGAADPRRDGTYAASG